MYILYIIINLCLCRRARRTAAKNRNDNLAKATTFNIGRRTCRFALVADEAMVEVPKRACGSMRNASSQCRRGRRRHVLPRLIFAVILFAVLRLTLNSVQVSVSTTVDAGPRKESFLPLASFSKRHYNVDWKDFSKAPHLHNVTLDGRPIPGLFRNKTLFLLGARLTTSYQDDNSVFATLFGFAQDPWKSYDRCDDPMGSLNYTTVVNTIQVYCQVECFRETERPCDKAVPMQLIHTVSADINQNNLTLIWNANLSHIVTRKDLQAHNDKALRLHFWTRTESSQLHGEELAVVDIPVSTGVVGHAGPQIQRDDIHSPTHHNVTLCVATYGERAPQYLPEFIQHHLNLGFAPIIIGIDTTMGSNLVTRLETYLSPYIRTGQASIMVSGGYECDHLIHQVLFYTPCLYHSKGISEYMAIWDIDEFWMPPSPNHTTPNVADVMASIQDYQQSHNCGESWCYHSFPSRTVFLRRGISPRTYPPYSIVGRFERRSDWFEEDWSKSITRTKYAYMGGIHMPGSCMFDYPPTKLMRKDDVKWSDLYYDHERFIEHCRNLRVKDDGTAPFGTMHHFASLMKERDGWEDDYKSSLPMDEYVQYYGERVFQQLNATFQKTKAR